MFAKMDYAYAVYKEGSFTRAAEKLFISQPSLSAAIKNLEKEIGAPLFERTGGGVLLTEAGRAYMDAVQRVMAIRSELEARISDMNGLSVGRLSVGGTNYLCSHVLAGIINRFSSQYPGVEVELVEAKSQSLLDAVRADALDIVVDSFDSLPEGFEGYPLAREQILLCVPAELPINVRLSDFAILPEQIYAGVSLADIPAVSIADFGAESFILLKSGNDMYNRAMHIFDRGGVTPRVAFSVDQLNISYALADSGMGLCFATDTLFRFARLGRSLCLYKIREADLGRTLCIAYKKSRYCTRAMTEFIRIARESDL